MRTFKIIIPMMLTVLASSCYTSLGVRISNQSKSNFNNSVLILLKPITIPASFASIKIQFGNLSQGKQLDKYHANCNFELRKIVEHDVIVEPDTFTIYQVRYDETYVQNNYIRYASLADIGGDETPMAIEYSTELYLKSDKQPDVFRMTCSHWEDPSFPQHLTLQQINSTLTGWFEIRNSTE